MDFFGIIYDMKNGKKVPYSKTYFDTLFAAKLGGSDVKTLTGALPLTFTTSETALRSWTLHGAHVRNTWRHIRYSFPTDIKTGAAGAADSWTITGNAEGVGERTKNLLSVEDYRQPAQTAITIDICDNETGRLKLAKTGTAQNRGLAYDGITFVDGQTYHFSFFNNAPQDDETGGRICLRRSDNNSIISGYSKTLRDAGLNEYSIAFDATLAPEGAYLFVMANGTTSATAEVDLSNFMIRLDGTTDGFIPFGYQIPITVSQTGQTTKSYEIFVGSSPLGAGQTVSDTQTIELFEGEQIIDIPLTNQPRLSIQVFSYYGIADNSNSGYVVRLEVTHNGSTVPVNVPVPTSMDEGDTVADVIPIPTEIGENTVSLNWDEYPPTIMTITYKE